MSTVIESLERTQLRRVPEFDAGDRLRVHFQVIEGTRRRVRYDGGSVVGGEDFIDQRQGRERLAAGDAPRADGLDRAHETGRQQHECNQGTRMRVVRVGPEVNGRAQQREQEQVARGLVEKVERFERESVATLADEVFIEEPVVLCGETVFRAHGLDFLRGAQRTRDERGQCEVLALDRVAGALQARGPAFDQPQEEAGDDDDQTDEDQHVVALAGGLRVGEQAVERVADAHGAQGLDDRVDEELPQADLGRQANLVDDGGQFARVVPAEVGGSEAHEVGESIAPQPVARGGVEHGGEVAHGHLQE